MRGTEYFRLLSFHKLYLHRLLHPVFISSDICQRSKPAAVWFDWCSYNCNRESNLVINFREQNTYFLIDIISSNFDFLTSMLFIQLNSFCSFIALYLSGAWLIRVRQIREGRVWGQMKKERSRESKPKSRGRTRRREAAGDGGKKPERSFGSDRGVDMCPGLEFHGLQHALPCLVSPQRNTTSTSHIQHHRSNANNYFKREHDC